MSSEQSEDEIQQMADFYGPVSGTVFHVDAHKRTTAKMIASRYDSQRGFEATTWSRKEVAILAANDSAADQVRDEIPGEDIVAKLEVTA